MKNATLAALALLLTPALGRAGQFLPPAVLITTSNSTAQGSLTGARISTNRLEYINCYIIVNSESLGVPVTGFCAARDAAGKMAQCKTTEREMIRAIEGINAASDVRFIWDSSQRCMQIFVRHASSNLE